MPYAELIGEYWRIRLFDPNLCYSDSFRTQDVGMAGSNMRIACMRRDTKRWSTQSWRIHKNNVKIVTGKKGYKTLSALNNRTYRILESIRSNSDSHIIKVV